MFVTMNNIDSQKCERGSIIDLWKPTLSLIFNTKNFTVKTSVAMIHTSYAPLCIYMGKGDLDILSLDFLLPLRVDKAENKSTGTKLVHIYNFLEYACIITKNL